MCFFYILGVCASELCLHVGMAFFFERLNMVFLCDWPHIVSVA